MSASQQDSVIRSARREGLVAIVLWLGATVYTVGYCWRHAYGRSPEELTFVYGIPDWVMWGIISPWAVCVAICWWFAYRFMRDEDLGPEAQPPDDELFSD